jgi:hypothetical protein
MANPVQTNLQVGNPAMGTVSRQPITTNKSVAGAPFVRLSRKAQTRGFLVAGEAYGGFISEVLKPAGGYLRNLRITIDSTTAGVLVAGVLADDGPWNVIQSLLFRDPLGQPILNIDGFGLYLVNKYSGQVGEGFQSDPANLPSFTVANADEGKFHFELTLPLELDSAAYCALSSLNAAAEPSIDIVLANEARVFSTPSGNNPTLSVRVDQPFWAVPQNDASLAPPDAGSSAQWTQVKGNQSVATGAAGDVVNPRVGTWMHTLIAVMRDNTNARIDGFGSQITLQLDGVPVLIEQVEERVDEMARFTDGIVRPTGVLAWTFRDAVKQVISLADTHDLLMPTTPATLMELLTDGAVIANSPATVQFYVGQLFPVNAQRIPYTHLGE